MTTGWPQPPQWQPVSSSYLTEVAWDEPNGELLVRFQDGSAYAYPGATSADYMALLRAPSPGKFFAANIRGRSSRVYNG